MRLTSLTGFELRGNSADPVADSGTARRSALGSAPKGIPRGTPSGTPGATPGGSPGDTLRNSPGRSPVGSPVGSSRGSPLASPGGSLANTPRTFSGAAFETAPCEPQTHRLVVFSADQAAPVYISEEFGLLRNRCSCLNEVSFKESPCKRSFRLAIQLWSKRSDEPWSVSEQWMVDLRDAKAHITTRNQPPARLTILTENGFILLGNEEKQNTSQNTGQSTGQQSTSQQSKNQQQTQQISSPNSQLGPEELEPLSDQDPNIIAPGEHDASDESLLSRWIPWGRSGVDGAPVKRSATSKLTSLSYPTLVDLWTLQHSLDEARAASLEISSQINASISSFSYMALVEKESLLRRRLRRIAKQIELIRNDTGKIKNEASYCESLQKSLTKKLDDSIRDAEDEVQPARGHVNGTTHMENHTQECHDRECRKKRSSLEKVSAEIRVEHGRLASQLLEIFPIDLVGDGKFHFAINGLLLPSVFAINHYDGAQVGAALGFVAQVLVCLSQYLDIALPYPITVFGSQSYITDNIAQIKHGSNKFPLWTRGVLLYRVEYALYLLHKDIEQLLNSLNLAVADLKQTLANLKNLLLVLSAEYKCTGVNS